MSKVPLSKSWRSSRRCSRWSALPVGELPGGSTTQGRTPQITPNAVGVREYLPGDPFNRISWLTTARTGRLMVKEFELDPTADVWLVLDMDGRTHIQNPAAGPLSEHDDPIARLLLNSTEEYAVTVTASLGRHFLNQNRTVGLMMAGQHREVIPTDRGARQLMKLLEALAVIRAEGQQPLPELLVAEAGRFGRHSTLIIVTASTDETIARALMPLVARGVKVVTIIVEPSTFGSAESAILLVSALAAITVPTYLIKRGEDIGRALLGGSARRAARRSDEWASGPSAVRDGTGVGDGAVPTPSVTRPAPPTGPRYTRDDGRTDCYPHTGECRRPRWASCWWASACCG